MSAASAAASRDPRARHDGGFDRWSFASRSGWSILWRDSDQATYALGDNHSVWTWVEGDRIWTRLPTDKAHMVYREHERTMRRLRRAVLVVKLLDSKMPGEREAARAALQRIGTAIAADWQFGGVRDETKNNIGWFDHPAAVYLAVTQECRFHLREQERMPFDPAIFATLVAAAQEDFTAGRRVQPPRLRPADLVYLQATLAEPAHDAGADILHAAAHAAPHAAPPHAAPPHATAEPADAPHDELEDMYDNVVHAREPEPDEFVSLREAIADAEAQEITAQAVWRKRRRFCLIAGSVAASLVLAFFVVSRF